MHRELMKYLGLRGRKEQETRENCILRTFMMCSSSNIIWVIKSSRGKLSGYVARVGEKIYAYRVLKGKFEGMRSLGRSRRSREDNVMKWILKKDCYEHSNEH